VQTDKLQFFFCSVQVDARGFVTTGDRRELKENQCFEMYITEVSSLTLLPYSAETKWRNGR
jgi:hypothetical protein